MAYEKLLREIAGTMRPFVARRVAAQAVDDLLQEVLMRVHAYRDSYIPGKPMKPWVNSIARNVIIDFSEKKKKLLAMFDGTDIGEIAGVHGSQFVAEDQLDQVLKQMPEDQRVAFKLTKLQGLTIQEGAKMVGASESAFRSRTARAIQSFKDLLKGADDDS
jgi:RNA polymerase sigma-70 factor (ECF subfamily)